MTSRQCRYQSVERTETEEKPSEEKQTAHRRVLGETSAIYLAGLVISSRRQKTIGELFKGKGGVVATSGEMDGRRLAGAAGVGGAERDCRYSACGVSQPQASQTESWEAQHANGQLQGGEPAYYDHIRK